MVFRGHLGADENRQMADLRINGVENPLAALPDFIDVLVVVEDPVQRLLRRRDVVAVRAEADDRRLDFPDVETNAVAGDDLTGREFVADKQIVDHPLHLFAAQ